jgi:hypothetical protein
METGYIIFICIHFYLYIYFLYGKENLSEDIITAVFILHWKITPTGKTEKYKYGFVQKGSMTR